MKLRDIQLLFDYKTWVNQLLLNTATALSPQQLWQPTGFPWISLQGTLVHILDSEHMWRILCAEQRVVSPRLAEVEPFTTLDSIAAYWQTEDAAMRAYLASLSDDDLESVIRYESDGNQRERVLWHCLVHIVNHGTQHRSEVATMLTLAGHSPGGIDLTLFLNDYP